MAGRFGWLRYLTLADRAIVLAVAGLVVVALVLPLRQPAGARVVVSRGDQVIYVARLDEDRRIELPGAIGITVLEIKDHKAHVLSSPCPNKICIRMGDIHQDGDVLACVPNELVIQIEDDHPEKEREHDFISR